MANGWVKSHRKIINWQWYTDIPTCHLFQHLVLVANSSDGFWRGIEIKRGQRITSLNHLAVETGLSVQQVRTALGKLKSTGELTSETTNQYTLVTLINYDFYQSVSEKTISEQQATQQTDNKRATNEQQTSNKRITTNKNNKKDKNDKNDKKKSITVAENDDDPIPYAEIVNYLNEKTGKSYKSTTTKTREHIRARHREGFGIDDFKKVIDKKVKEWGSSEKMKDYLRPDTLFSTKFEWYLNQESDELEF